MKFLVALAALFVAVNAVTIEEASEKWISFKTTHSKQYHPKEEQKRFRIFQENIMKIEEHNSKYESGEVSYYFGVNQFADLTGEEFLAMMNAQISDKPEINSTSHFEADPKADVPETIDWRSKGGVLPVQNQGNCESSWAFSAIGALESLLAIKYKGHQKLSVQQLVDCSTDNAGCKIGWIDRAFIYIEQNGICAEKNYPYTALEGTCKECERVLTKIGGFVDVDTNENALKAAVGTVGPVSVAVNANGWQFYGGGIFTSPMCNSEPVNHGVLAVGYGVDSADYWILKNSWGTNWGESGYIRLSRGSNQCHVAENACYPQL